MSFINELKLLSTRKGFLLVSAGVLNAVIWIILFSLFLRTLNPFNILINLIALPIGSLFYIMWSSNHDQKISYFASCILLGIVMTCLAVITDPILTIIFLIMVGLITGYLIPIIFSIFRHFFKNPEYAGRTYFFVYTGVTGLLILEVFIVLIEEALHSVVGNIVHFLYLAALILIIITTFFIGKDESILLPRKTSLRFYLRKNILPYPTLLMSFFIGFFMTNMYYTLNMLLEKTDLVKRIDFSWDIFLLVLFATSLLICLPSGYLYDKIGRRWSILIGFYLEAIAFISSLGIVSFILAGVPSISDDTIQEIYFFLILPIITGMGLSLALFGGLLVVIYEQAPKRFQDIHGGLSSMVFGLGMIFGYIAVIALEPLANAQTLLPITIVFIYFTATIVIFQTDEPLPAKAELEWRSKMEHVIILSREEGLPLFSQPFQKHELVSVSDGIEAGGAIIGFSNIINRIIKASEIKVIKQKSYCIMLEEGSHIILAVITLEEINTVRNRMLDFIIDFEDFFEDVLEDWSGDVQVFIPAKKLLQKHFAL